MSVVPSEQQSPWERVFRLGVFTGSRCHTLLPACSVVAGTENVVGTPGSPVLNRGLSFHMTGKKVTGPNILG